MIHYLVTRDHAYTTRNFLADWAPDLAPRFIPTAYETLALRRQIPTGVYIFSDLERFSPAFEQLAVLVWEALERHGGCVLLNHPKRVTSRVELLRRLHSLGKNDFAVYPADDDLTAVRFPVFLRRLEPALVHAGPQSTLLHSQAELSAELNRLRAAGIRPSNVLIVEFCDTRCDDGRFRKYSAFRVKNRIVPRHVLHSMQWVQKYPDIVDAAAIQEESDFLDSNPHAAGLLEIFDLAGIDFGRIDYAMREGRIITWEINTNPNVIARKVEVPALRQPMQAKFISLFRTALLDISQIPPSGRVRIDVPKPLKAALKVRWPDRVRRSSPTAGCTCGIS
jgi:hypothetical protein